MNQPAALLLDEPLGALDVKLRKQMQLELKRIQHELGTTFVYVTHDQDEALSMSDRIAVMNQGVIEQLGTPREIYEHPATPFVADFVGVLNAMDVRVDEVAGEDLVMRVNERDRSSCRSAHGDRRGGRIVAARGGPAGACRSHDRRRSANGGSRLSGTVAQVVYLGTLTQFHVDTAIGKRLIVHRLSDDRPRGAAGRPGRADLDARGRAPCSTAERSGQPTSVCAPRFRSWSAMMVRWISLVPSQMRSTRSSR